MHSYLLMNFHSLANIQTLPPNSSAIRNWQRLFQRDWQDGLESAGLTCAKPDGSDLNRLLGRQPASIQLKQGICIPLIACSII